MDSTRHKRLQIRKFFDQLDKFHRMLIIGDAGSTEGWSTVVFNDSLAEREILVKIFDSFAITDENTVKV